MIQYYSLNCTFKICMLFHNKKKKLGKFHVKYKHEIILGNTNSYLIQIPIL